MIIENNIKITSDTYTEFYCFLLNDKLLLKNINYFIYHKNKKNKGITYDKDIDITFDKLPKSVSTILMLSKYTFNSVDTHNHTILKIIDKTTNKVLKAENEQLYGELNVLCVFEKNNDKWYYNRVNCLCPTDIYTKLNQHADFFIKRNTH